MKIYALMSGITCLYVGQTKKELKEREYFHRNKGNATCSRYIPKDMEWTIELIEECEDSISRIRERYYYDLLEPLYNKQTPNQTPNQYYKTNINKIRERQNKYMKEYYQRKKLTLDKH